ncbi:hypothetical protein [Saccharicrinis aurantiacus]|uniref:hypothetical protein n=1 Tax=Saccharicrinis aurantiacus TaxID=1849719 RepID=UPI00249350FC|nr:hypothetical protein [Saccharicrinis aurantiacus]
MKKLVNLFIISILLIACDEKEIKLYPTIEHDATIIVADNGNFEKQAIIYASTINESIQDLEFEDAGIEDVYIEGVWINVKTLGMNEADTIALDLTIKENNQLKYLLDNYELVIPDDEEEIFLPDYLQKEGVDALHNLLKDIVVSGAADTDIEFLAMGQASPEDSYINVELEILIKGTVVFSQTIGVGE